MTRVLPETIGALTLAYLLDTNCCDPFARTGDEKTVTFTGCGVGEGCNPALGQ